MLSYLRKLRITEPLAIMLDHAHDPLPILYQQEVSPGGWGIISRAPLGLANGMVKEDVCE